MKWIFKISLYPGRCVPDRLCGGLPVPLRLFHDAVVQTGLRLLYHCPEHDDFAGTVFRGTEIIVLAWLISPYGILLFASFLVELVDSLNSRLKAI